jgi:hypothetical protein
MADKDQTAELRRAIQTTETGAKAKLREFRKAAKSDPEEASKIAAQLVSLWKTAGEQRQELTQLRASKQLGEGAAKVRDLERTASKQIWDAIKVARGGDEKAAHKILCDVGDLFKQASELRKTLRKGRGTGGPGKLATQLKELKELMAKQGVTLMKISDIPEKTGISQINMAHALPKRVTDENMKPARRKKVERYKRAAEFAGLKLFLGSDGQKYVGLQDVDPNTAVTAAAPVPSKPKASKKAKAEKKAPEAQDQTEGEVAGEDPNPLPKAPSKAPKAEKKVVVTASPASVKAASLDKPAPEPASTAAPKKRAVTPRKP